MDNRERWSSRNQDDIAIYIPESFEGMRKAGSLAADILDYISPFVIPGVSTLKLDEMCHNEIIRNNAIPAPLNYKGFPKSICTSINHVICHGIPNAEDILRDGDIVNIDVTVILDGWYGDTSRMFLVGKHVPRYAKKLVDVTYDAMMAAITSVRPGSPLSVVGQAIESVVKPHSYSIVRDFCGHGIGRIFHDEPQVLHYQSNEMKNITLQAGMFFTIEPMINIGKEGIRLLSDGWTAVTRDGSLSAQFEHTIGVTERGYEIFTLSSKEKAIGISSCGG